MGGSLEKLKYFTIYSLFTPEKLMTQNGSSIWMLGTLFLIGILCYMLAIRVFVKRDLYL